MTIAMSRAGSSGEPGFTLLEVLVVLLVLSLAGALIGAAAPSSRDRAKLVEAQARIESMLIETRSQARHSASVTRAVFDLDGRRIQGGSAKWMSLPEGVELSITSARELGSPRLPAVAFLPDGTSSGAELTLRVGSYSTSWQVEWLTGRISP